MLRGLAASGDAPEWSIYILRCGDGTLYTGIAKDPAARLAAHQAGRGAAYTRTHAPVRMIYAETGFTRSGALIREAQIKRFPRAKKERLVQSARAAGPSRARRFGAPGGTIGNTFSSTRIGR